MRNVRWAHAALLAVVLPACAHTSQNEVQNPASVQNEDSEPTHVPADSEWTASADETKKQSAKSARRVFLASTSSDFNNPNNPNPLRQEEVVVDAPSCDPWSADATERCDLDEMVATSTP
jgi:hypothetical protein